MDQATAQRQLEEVERIEKSAGWRSIPVWVDVVEVVLLGALGFLGKYQSSMWIIVALVPIVAFFLVIDGYVHHRLTVRTSMRQNTVFEPGMTGTQIVSFVAFFTGYWWLPSHSWPGAIVAGVLAAALVYVQLRSDRKKGTR